MSIEHLIPVNVRRNDPKWPIILALNLFVLGNYWLRDMTTRSESLGFYNPETRKRILSMYSTKFRMREKYLRDLIQRILLFDDAVSSTGWFILDRHLLERGLQ